MVKGRFGKWYEYKPDEKGRSSYVILSSPRSPTSIAHSNLEGRFCCMSVP